MSDKLNVARIKKFGKNFEISILPEKALKYKKGEITDIMEVLLVDNIFSNAKKGLVVADKELEEAFKTNDVHKIAEIIIKKGEIQVTAEQRAEEREKRKRRLIDLIHKQAVDPTTNLPHPPTRIEAALDEGKIAIDDHKSIEEQFNEIITKLRPIIPLKIEQKQMIITIPSQFAGKSYQIVKSNSKILQEEWKSDGSWQVTVELPAGMQQEFIDKLNSLTHGEVIVEV